jgi:hypothetical protein
LEQSRMLLRLVKLLLQGLNAEHCVVVPLQQIGLLAGSLSNILQRATQSMSTQYSATQGHSEYSQRTLIHCFIRHHDSMLRATTAGSTRLSSSSSRPSRLVDVAPAMGAARISAITSISGSRTTTSLLAPGSRSTHVSTWCSPSEG